MLKNFLLHRLLPRSVFQINPGMIRNLDFLLVGNFTHSDAVVEAISFFMDHPEFFEERRTGLMLPMPEKLHADHFDFAAKATADAQNPKVEEWEQLMWTFQQPLPFAAPGEKWMLMKKIFTLS